MQITKEMINQYSKYWIHTSKGGLSHNQIQRSNGSVVPNCTGNATGMFLLYIKLTTGEFREDIRNALIHDGENYWWQVTNPKGQLYGKLEYGQEAREGAIMCFSGGSSGCGHVCFVDKVNSKNDVWAWTSSYGGNQDHEYERDTNNNGNWSYVKSLKFQGFIYPPTKKPQPTPPTPPTPEEDFIEYEVQSGDTFWELAKKFYGDPYKYTIIMEDNGYTDARELKTYAENGKKLKIRKL